MITLETKTFFAICYSQAILGGIAGYMLGGIFG
ncbi:hypothetical protein LCGC14_0586170 [marine sediment metagenome]|uniref:Uncharacterized protein n=1 Tax=marine sediment metagenome TaxID=412755 RepID=A0A0F9U0Y7_9ZZZZ